MSKTKKINFAWLNAYSGLFNNISVPQNKNMVQVRFPEQNQINYDSIITLIIMSLFVSWISIWALFNHGQLMNGKNAHHGTSGPPESFIILNSAIIFGISQINSEVLPVFVVISNTVEEVIDFLGVSQ